MILVDGVFLCADTEVCVLTLLVGVLGFPSADGRRGRQQRAEG